MILNHEKITIDDLTPGMYISRLDRPWIDTPFPIQGFHVRDNEDIKNLHVYCRYVYIDRNRSSTTDRLSGTHHRPAIPPPATADLIKVDQARYPRLSPMMKSVDEAATLHHDVRHTLDHLASQIQAGKTPDIRATRQTAVKMVDNITRNPDAFIWIAHLRAKDHHAYGHAIRASIWAIAFGRHLGIQKDLLQDLAMGMLLSDIGISKIPRAILEKTATLSAKERYILESHVAKSLALLQSSKGLSQNTLDAIATHHERHNGKGYPQGLRGSQIPLSGKIAGLVDYYEDLTCPRIARQALSPANAMVRLHQMRYEEFQGELIDEFIQAIGIYPTGSLIEFKSGEVGVISEQNFGWRLRPKVMVLLNQHKKVMGRPLALDLLNHAEDKQAARLEILRSLPEGSHGIDLMQFRTRGLARFLGLGNTLFAQ